MSIARISQESNFDDRRGESGATLEATDLRDITDLSRARMDRRLNDSDWIDPFIKNFHDYLNEKGRQQKNKEGAKLWTAEEIGNQLLNFLRGATPVEPTSPEDQAKAMNRIDHRRHYIKRIKPQYEEGVTDIPTPVVDGSIRAVIRNMRQHSQGMGGKI